MPLNSSAPSPFLVRPAGATDIDAIFHVRTSVRENALTWDELAALGITPASIHAAITAAPCAWVVERDGKVVGFAMADLPEACLFAVFVLPEHEGQGVGRQLIQAGETALFRHHPVIWLETDATSRAAAVYRHLGWTPAGDAGDGDVRLQKLRP